MTASFLNHNVHTRNSHHLASSPAPPPPSTFSRSGAAVRSSLKKIPSSFFNKDDKFATKKSAKVPVFVDEQSSARNTSTRIFASKPLASSPQRTNTQSTLVAGTGIDTSKPKTKTRRAFKDILSWGHSNHASAPSPSSKIKGVLSSSPPPKAPSVPPKDSMPAVLKKKSSRQLLNKTSTSALSGYASLRAPHETPQSRARPSMGEDPFSRHGQGAEVVETVIRYPVGTPLSSCGSSDHRSSMSSGKTLSQNMYAKDENAAKRAGPCAVILPEIAEPRLASPPRHSSVPVRVLPTIVDLPPRSASLGRVLEVKLPSPPPPATLTFEKTPAKTETFKTINKEKTKSKVWGIFRGKSKKEKPTASPERPPRRALEIKDISAPTIKSAIPKEPAPAAVSVLRAFAPHEHNDSIRSVSSSLPPRTSVQTAFRQYPRPPVLHIQQPSVDETEVLESVDSFDIDRFADAPYSPFHEDSLWKNTTISVQESSTFAEAVKSAPEDPLAEVVDAVTAKVVPKRKRLTGVFGLALKHSLEKIKRQTSGSSLRSQDSKTNVRMSPIVFGGQTLRSLAEDKSGEETTVQARALAEPYQSRFDDSPLENKSFLRSNAGLRRVASATDKLSALVSLDFSPAATANPSPSDRSSLGSPLSMVSLESSPTPMRRIRSAVLTRRKSAGNPLRAGRDISPLKLALHRAQVEATTPKETTQSVPRTSMVRKGMRNVFAPPTPPPKPVFGPHFASRMSIGPTASPSRDVPEDLEAIVGDISHDSSSSAMGTLGLPPVPPANRVTPRRNNNAFAPPSISLPPVPEIPSQYATRARVNPGPPRLTLNITDEENGRTSIFSECLEADNRNSFDFTSEYASLDLGNQRASFVAALAEVRGISQHDLPSMPSISSPLAHCKVQASQDVELSCTSQVSSLLRDDDEDILQSDSDSDCDEDDVEEELEREIATAVVQLTPSVQRTPRPTPFQGQVAFQKHIAQTRATPPQQPAFSLTSTTPEVKSAAVPPPASPVHQEAAPTRRRGHRRGESGLSIASMSSMGSVIETGIAGEYTNYFEVNFKDQIKAAPPLPSLPNQASHSRESSADSMGSRRSSRAHHRRNSSIVSVESLADFDLSSLALGLAGPPVSMHNSRRTSYISRHRRGASSESFGRSDWAAQHRRNASIESNASDISIVRLGRPGLGERMFQLDGGVQLTSITGSPPEASANADQERRVMPADSYDSLLDRSKLTYDSILDKSNGLRDDSILDATPVPLSKHVPTSSTDSVFSVPPSNMSTAFLLKGLRPMSTMSNASNCSDVARHDLTFELRKYANTGMSPVPKGAATCLEADGEDTSMSQSSLNDSVSLGRQLLNASHERPAKPRRRPANLVFNKSIPAQPDTPALSSPSTSEASSRLSLETVSFLYRVRPIGRGHARQKSSLGITVHSTIKEEPSIATLRNVARGGAPIVRQQSWCESTDDDEMEVEVEPVAAVKQFVEWKREADDEYRRTRAAWIDSEESKHAVAEFKLPMTSQEISDFLASSSQSYKPLDQLPISTRVAHRRKSSLGQRQLFSPYGLPLPKLPSAIEQKPKMSLLTKFERTKSSSTASSGCSWEDGPGSTPTRGGPLSAVFARFAQIPPSPAPASAPVNSTNPFSPFANATFDLSSSAKAPKNLSVPPSAEVKGASYGEEKRSRVNSNARRAALGWGRRRNSDGPTMVEQMARQYGDHSSMRDLPCDLREAVQSTQVPRVERLSRLPMLARDNLQHHQQQVSEPTKLVAISKPGAIPSRNSSRIPTKVAHKPAASTTTPSSTSILGPRKSRLALKTKTGGENGNGNGSGKTVRPVKSATRRVRPATSTQRPLRV